MIVGVAWIELVVDICQSSAPVLALNETIYTLPQYNRQHYPQTEHNEPECRCRGSRRATQTCFMRRDTLIEEKPCCMMAF